MIKIRYATFETNSSSTHSLIMCSADEYEALKKGELLIDGYTEELLTLQQAKKKYNEHNLERGNITWGDIDYASKEEAIDLLREYDIAYTLDCWLNERHEELEDFVEEYTTKNGEKVIAFGVYGNDY